MEEIKTRGVHNWKNLFRKPSMSDWTILICIMFVLGLSYLYMQETDICRETMNNIRDNSCTICNGGTVGNINYSSFNKTIIFNEELLKSEG